MATNPDAAGAVVPADDVAAGVAAAVADGVVPVLADVPEFPHPASAPVRTTDNAAAARPAMLADLPVPCPGHAIGLRPIGPPPLSRISRFTRGDRSGAGPPVWRTARAVMTTVESPHY
jgi:hypothetical protein